MRSLNFYKLVTLLACIVLTASLVSAQKKMDRIEKERALMMLKNVHNAIEKNYYDAKFGGIDLDARFKLAEEKLKASDTLGQAFSVIAQAVIDLNDSHTWFSPPFRNAIVDYGWNMKMFGEKCFITKVKQKSDAESKGLKVGDEVLSVNGFRPARSEMWKVIYYYQQLNPQAKMALTVKSPKGEPHNLELLSKVTPLQKKIDLTNSFDINDAIREGDKVGELDRHIFKPIGGVVIWKMPNFAFDPSEVDGMIGSNIKDKQGLIVDLRNNPGGYVVTLERVVGFLFDHDVKIADLVGRKPMDPQEAKSQGKDSFKGKLVVLIDSNSGSAAEIFARLMQLEKRGTVIGDISAGAVMQSRYFSMDVGNDTLIQFGASITNADVIMSDGKSIEKVGVTPDEIVIPNGDDLEAQRDPALARALEVLGVKMTPKDAGSLYPPEKDVEKTTNLIIRLREF